MLDLLSSLSIRGYLKRAQRSGQVIGIVMSGYEAFPCRVVKTNLLTVEVEVLADDEETYLAKQVHPIRNIQYVDVNNVIRFKNKLMASTLNGRQAERPAEEEHIFEDEDDC